MPLVDVMINLWMKWRKMYWDVGAVNPSYKSDRREQWDPEQWDPEDYP